MPGSDRNDRLARCWTLLATPVGQPGSGRIRAEAARVLHDAGAIGDRSLALYEMLLLEDRTDPRKVLRLRGLSLED